MFRSGALKGASHRMANLFHRIQVALAPPNSFQYKAVRRLLKIFRIGGAKRNLRLIRSSTLFDPAWYLKNNPDVATARVDPLTHYLQYGGFEGRDPGPGFSSGGYLDTYKDVKQSGMNPLVHYLRYGMKEGRLAQPPLTAPPYKCPVCGNPVDQFLPLPAFYKEQFLKYGYPYTRAEDIETTNLEQYFCPRCAASDRDRLYACYLDERIPGYPEGDHLLLLDIAPSQPLGHFIERFKQVDRRTADLFTEGTDLVVDITNMPEIPSDAYDILICSHVLEHVSDDRKALLELYRVLKPGGWGIIMVPIVLTVDQMDEDPTVTNVAERWRRFGQDDHVRLYNKSGFIERVEEAGFTLHQLGRDYFGESTFKQYGIASTSVLYIAEKTNKATFADRILHLIREASYYEAAKAEEAFVEPSWQTRVNIESSWQKRRNTQKTAFEKLNNEYDLEGLEFTYNLLGDEYSKEMLLRVIVGRVMGSLRCRLPLYYSHIWKYFDDIDALRVDDHCIKVGMWDFYLYGLGQIGFDVTLYSSKIGIFINFILEQYKFQNKVFVAEGDYVIDGGACYGDTALYFADLVQETGKVFSFEFIKSNLEYFHKNMELNPEKQNTVQLIERPLWSNSHTELSAVESGSGSHLSMSSSDKNSPLYRTISIDDFVAQNEIERIDFIKLDIEGAELDTLKGSVETIRKHKPRLAICVYHKNSDFWEIPKFLKELDLNYEFYLDHFVTTPLYETVLFARVRNLEALK